MTRMQAVDAGLRRAESALGAIAAVMLLATMFVVVTDVGLRYLLHRPLAWSYDLIGMYLMVGIFFFSLSGTLDHDEHVCVDLLHKHMPHWMRHLAEAVGYVCGSAVFAAIVWMGVARTLASFAAGEVSAGAIPWPTWLSCAAVPLGAGLMLLRMVFRAIGHAASLLAGRSLVALPRIAGTEGEAA